MSNSTITTTDTIKGVLPWATQPFFWKHSAEWMQLSNDLSCRCPGGGPAICTLFDRFLDLWGIYLKAKYNSAGKSKKDEVIENFEKQVKTLEAVLETVLWEKLHTGIWKDVSLIWRDAYSFSCLLSAIGTLELGSQVKERRQKALRCLDLACLMGGDLWKEIVFHFISDLVQLEILHDEHNDTTLDNSDGKPHHLLLPPGALGASSLSHPIDRHCLLSLETFATEYMLPQHPVIISGAMDTWPALKNWQQVEYWRRHAGPRTVPVEIGKNYMVEGWRQQLMLFSEFLDKHLVSSTSRVDVSSGKNPSECVYLAQHDLMAQIPHLAADVHQPEYCSLGQPVHATNTWMGPCGTVTPLHTDPEQNLLCQVVGRKYIRLYSPEHSRALLGSGGGGSNDSLTMNTSAVDVDTHPLIIDTPDGDEVGGQEAEEENEVGETANKSVHTDATRGEGREIESVEFPLYASTPFLDCILESGEMLYIPAGWWHYVKSLSTSASVNFWWRR